MRITLLRHATLLLELQGLRLLVDPMLSAAGANPPIENTANERRNPLVPLPEVQLEPLDAILVSHLHSDHFDDPDGLLDRRLPLFCQPEDVDRLRELGFEPRPIEDAVEWQGLTIHRTGACHGRGAIGEAMAPASGFVFDRLYIAGDSVWCPAVEEAIERHAPSVAVVNAGRAEFLEGGPITMTAEDVAEVVSRVPRVVAVHMEAINHCGLTRAELAAAVPGALIPADGETLEL